MPDVPKGKVRKGTASAGTGPFSNDPNNPPPGPACPACESANTYELSYGYPGHDVITGHEPRWCCRNCKKGFGRIENG
jgi:hypothetical protein